MKLASLKNIINKMCLQIIYLKYMYEEDLALNNLQGFICHKMQPNHEGWYTINQRNPLTNHSYMYFTLLWAMHIYQPLRSGRIWHKVKF